MFYGYFIIMFVSRWFYKYKEVWRLFELRPAVQEYDFRHENDGVGICGLDDEDWRLIEAYLIVVEPFERATKVLGGDTYPAAGMVVPMLDDLLHDLEALPEKKSREEVVRLRRRRERGEEGAREEPIWGEEGEGRRLVMRVIDRFNFRFPNQFKYKAPFNALCLLDPRYLDIYCEADEELRSVMNVIKEDTVYDEIKMRERDADEQNNEQAVQPSESSDRRAQLIARKKARLAAGVEVGVQGSGQSGFETKINKEVCKLKCQIPVSKEVNPLDWWKVHSCEFPLLSLFMKANGAFQPTSLASERLFNKDKMLFGTTRQSLTEEHGEGFIFLHDFLNKRMAEGEYRICETCPNPPKQGSNYRRTCPQHNQ